ncbi:hypothetical protein JWJ90_17045 [Desulfobulbus rhabdoformis]|uniref:hypothetical protein n=1 Tax=Desulfobulbus rhabdoformis TaxID=34032 RepID=UPI0019647E14|nr:hypothetical protein [Desulfobulbus rhabdoformis]MBM9615978.1 hypothetical protein [Desulfobulbus rhabdoformis]
MFTLKMKGIKELEKQLKSLPGKTRRAANVALNKTGKAIKEEIRKEMERVFERPTPYTLNSMQLTPARKGELEAKVWLKEPDRMSQHYLVPQVEGGERKLAGYERAIGLGHLYPTQYIRKNIYGNVSAGQIRQILSVLGMAETSAGYSANLTVASVRRNFRSRDYFVLRHRHGRLYPGVYQRVQTGTGFGHKTKRTIARFGSYQKGRRKIPVRDPRTGRIIRWVYPKNRQLQSIVRAQGVRPIFLKGRGAPVIPLLPFYHIAQRVFDEEFEKIFNETLKKFLKS